MVAGFRLTNRSPKSSRFTLGDVRCSRRANLDHAAGRAEEGAQARFAGDGHLSAERRSWNLVWREVRASHRVARRRLRLNPGRHARFGVQPEPDRARDRRRRPNGSQRSGKALSCCRSSTWFILDSRAAERGAACLRPVRVRCCTATRPSSDDGSPQRNASR